MALAGDQAETEERRGAAAGPLAPYKRLTIKIGSALLVDSLSGRPRGDWLDAIATDLAVFKSAGRELVIVSSGAIALGRRLLGLNARSLPLEESQAAASVGQIALSQAWEEALGRHGLTAGQILLTPNITEERRYFLNARTTINTLLSLGAVPIINENDTVATTEIRYGDNDRLSARVASMIEADCLVLLSDVDGLYTAPPGKDPAARHIDVVDAITPEIEAMAGAAASHLSRGGMTTKIEAGRIATLAGTAMIIARGVEANPLRRLAEGARHTLFRPASSPAAARKRWIMGSLEVAGRLTIDAGAARALNRGSSLLPIGVTDISGAFHRGDIVEIVDAEARPVARGLAGLDAAEAQLVKGRQSRAVTEILGPGHRAEMVHRDNLVLVPVPEAHEK